LAEEVPIVPIKHFYSLELQKYNTLVSAGLSSQMTMFCGIQNHVKV